MEKNEIYEVEIIDIGANGEGIAKVDNYVLFIPYALKGEIVKVLILKANKSFGYAKLLEIIKPSKDRTEPKCPVFYKCGGCDLQHCKYESTLIAKTNNVKSCIEKTCRIELDVLPCIPSDKCYGYRNKLQLPLSTDGIGFYAKNSHRVVPITDCPITESWCKEVISCIKEYIKATNASLYNEEKHTGLMRHLVARYIDDNLMLTIVINGNSLPQRDVLINILSKKFNSFSLFENINKEKTNVILGTKLNCIKGESNQKCENFGIKYEISPFSFLQVNTYIQNQIYHKVLENINSDDLVVDAYSGAGLLTAICATKSKMAYGIEIVKEATENANKLKTENNIQNMVNINGDCAVELPKLLNSINQTTNLCVVLDPPRKGCDEKVLQSIMQCKASKILYVSCNPATLARDLSILQSEYNIDFVQPYDMFPQTRHVETLVKLARKH